MSKHTMRVHDDASLGLGTPLEVTVTDETFAYGVAIQLQRGNERAEIVLDYFDGKLTVRQYPIIGDMEQIGHMEVVFEPGSGEESSGDE